MEGREPRTGLRSAGYAVGYAARKHCRQSWQCAQMEARVKHPAVLNTGRTGQVRDVCPGVQHQVDGGGDCHAAVPGGPAGWRLRDRGLLVTRSAFCYMS
jgi:hypothetical protein